MSAGKGSFAYADAPAPARPASAAPPAPATHAYPPIDPTKNQVILIVGKKGSGKSVAGRTMFRAWPGADRLVLDITGDADPGADLEPIALPKDASALPAYNRDQGPQVYRWIPDTRSPTYRDDVDRALGMALFPRERHVVLWGDEDGEIFPVNNVGPHGRTALHQGRHHNLSMILCGPRAIGIDPLCISQADRVLIYDTPHPADRERIAANIGVRPTLLSQELDATRKGKGGRGGPHWYLMYVAEEDQLYRCPPLPMP